MDAHLDLGMNALAWDRDLTQEVTTIRALEVPVPGPGRGQGTVALPELRRGRVALCVATSVSRSTGTPVPGVDFRSAAQAHGAARGQFAYYDALQRLGHVRVLTEPAALADHIAAWRAWEETPSPNPNAAPPIGLVLSMESADPVLTPDDLDVWQRIGIRLIGPAHYGPGRYAGGTGVESGLTPAGVELLRGMQGLGIALDVTHLSDRAFWEALDVYQGPVIASHNNCRALVPHQRQLTDDQLRALLERDAVIGAAADTWMLQLGWIRGHSSNAEIRLERLCDHIDRVCQLAGDARHAGIGSDLDGGFGRNQSPSDLDTIADLQHLAGLLAARGYRDEDVAAILHGNFIRVLGQVLTGPS
ncbi:MAG: membrane dipeptidase [Candidatus Dormiibacterota bacterium]